MAHRQWARDQALRDAVPQAPFESDIGDAASAASQATCFAKPLKLDSLGLMEWTHREPRSLRRSGVLWGTICLCLACGGATDGNPSSAPSDDGQAGFAASNSGASFGGGNSSASGTGNTGARFSSGYPEDTTLPDLEQEDFDALCDASYEYTNVRLSTEAEGPWCRYLAILIAEIVSPADDSFQETCRAHYTTCLEGEQQLGEQGIKTCPSRTATCTATVGDYERCVTGSQLAFEATLAQVPDCDDVSVTDLPLRLASPPVSEACVAYTQKCPG